MRGPSKQLILQWLLLIVLGVLLWTHLKPCCGQAARPHAAVYSSIIDVLWQTGITWAQDEGSIALQLSCRASYLSILTCQMALAMAAPDV